MSDERQVVPGEIIAYRSWILDGTLRRPRLLSLNEKALWPANDWIVAACRWNHEDGIPGENCSCGIHAARTRGHLMDMNYHDWGRGYGDPELVVGEVALAGKVIPGDQGWLAERARPYRLWVPHLRWRWANSLQRAYRVPAGVINPQTEEEPRAWT